MSKPKIINGIKYKLISEIASGGFGKVYLVENKKIKYALKEQSGNYDFTENEAKIMKSFDHPSIIKVIDYDTDKTTNPKIYSYLMEYTELGNMRKLIGNKYEAVEASVLFLQILEGLKYIHSQGYVRRDLKPENIILFDDNKLKITDFGLAKKLDENTRTDTFKNSGTARYSSPEVFRIEKSNIAIRQKSDIYALGVMFFEILSQGKLPYEMNTANWVNIHENPMRTKICDLRTDIDWKFGKIIDKMNKPNISDRYDNCDEIITDIKKAVGGPSIIPDNLSKIFYNKDSEIEKEKLQEELEEQSFEQKKSRILVICDDFIDTLNNAFLELKKNCDSKSLEFGKKYQGFRASYHQNFLDFNYELVCDSLNTEKLFMDKLKENQNYKNSHFSQSQNRFLEAKRFNTVKVSAWKVEMYLKHDIVAGGFLRIGNKIQDKYEYAKDLYVSSSWGCNFLLSY